MTEPLLLNPDSPWFFPLFVLMWLAISGLLALISGWHGLAGQFPDQPSATGERFRFAAAAIGWPWLPVSYSGCLFLTFAPGGMRMSILFPFRLLSPPMFIPWTAVESIVERRLLFWRSTVLTLRDNGTRIRLYGPAGRYLARTRGTSAS